MSAQNYNSASEFRENGISCRKFCIS